MNESLHSLAAHNSASASFEFNGAQVYLNAQTADQLLADLAKFGKASTYEAVANKPKSAKVSAAEKSTVANITAEQARAVDDTAGLEEQNAGKSAPVADTKPTAAAAKADAPEQKAKASVEYPVLQKAVFDLAAKSREAVMEVAATFGVKTFKELSADRYAEALDAVKAKHAALVEEVA